VDDDLLDDCARLAAEEMEFTPPSVRKRACYRKIINRMRNDAGVIVEVTPKMSSWWFDYVESPMVEDDKFQKKFRRRFRCKYDSYLKLMTKVLDSELFRRWLSVDCIGRQSSPIELMVLGSLRYLGRGWTFDDLEEATSIAEETHRQFFHVFIEWGRSTLFQEYVITPRTQEEAEIHMREMREAGFHGSVGSQDATHIGMERCSYDRWNMHKGAKLNMPSRTYNMTVSHRRRILSTTTGHPARWNDKTLVLFDSFTTGIRKGELLSDVTYNLFEKDGDGEVKEVTYKGGWLLVDNGYLKWSCTIPPYKESILFTETRWAEWLESMRKDVECTFGILKGRFRVLKTGVRIHGIEATDKIWLTCCALHNFLLEEDGLDKEWENGVRSDWEGSLGYHNAYDVVNHATRNFPLGRLQTNNQRRRYDASGVGRGSDGDADAPDLGSNDDNNDENIVAEDPPVGSDGIRYVRKLSMDYFRKRLVEHFDILYQRNEIKWPSRLGMPQPNS
jgi:hypothetical protein